MNATVRAGQMSRKARFRASLALARLTVQDWCGLQGFTSGHLYQVLRGDRISPDTLKKVDAFIAEQLEKVA